MYIHRPPNHTTHFVDLPLSRLHIMEAGEGEPLIIVPATISELENWRELTKFMAQWFHVHFFELPGHGESSPCDGKFSSQKVAELVEQLVDELGFERFNLRGFSFGGILAMRTIFKHLSRRIDRLIMISPAQRLAAGGAIAERDLEVAERSRVASDAQLENAIAVLSAAERKLQKTRLRAPFPGIVSERTVSVGDVVQTGTALFTVVDPSSMRLEATAPVSALAALKVGSQVEFQVSGYDGRAFSGRVLRINPTVDPGTRQVRITVAIPNQGNNLVAGLFARGRVTAEERTAVAVPFAALDQRGAIPTLRRIRGGRVETVAVTLGLRDEILEMVEVLSGVAVGDSILRAGAAGLAPGTVVVVTKE